MKKNNIKDIYFFQAYGGGVKVEVKDIHDNWFILENEEASEIIKEALNKGNTTGREPRQKKDRVHLFIN